MSHVKQMRTHSSTAYLTDERFEEVGLVSEWVVNESVAERHDPVWKVVLGQPGHHALLLHVRATRDVNDQVAQVLPEPGKKREA